MKHITIAMLGHVDAGKTTLIENLMYRCHFIKEMGKVDKHNTYFDYDQQERQRGITIYSKQCHLTYQDMTLHVLDTPGHVDFSSEMERTLQVLDYAIVIINGLDGVQSHTRTIFKLLAHFHIPTFIFVNKMDQSYFSKDKLLLEMQENLSSHIYQVDDMFDENVALSHDSYLDEYMINNKLKQDTIKHAIKQRHIFPCFFGSALKDEGVEEMLDYIYQMTIIETMTSSLSGQVFKITYQQSQMITHLKLTGGKLAVKDTILGEKIDQIRLYNGEKYELLKEAYPGEVIALTGVTCLEAGMNLQGQKDNSHLLQPLMSYHVILDKQYPFLKAVEHFQQLEKEDPYLDVVIDKQDITLKVMGEVQLEILKTMLKERFSMDVDFDLGHLTYKETISNIVEGVGHFEPLRHYSEVHLLLEPLKRGQGLVFESRCSSDMLSKNYQSQVLTTLKKSVLKGVLTGSEITDMKITLVSGKAHLKHTEGGDFQEATLRALRQGLKKAQNIILEPYYALTIVIEQSYLSAIIYELQQRHCQFEIIQDDKVIIKATGPVSYLLDYPMIFVSQTNGTGRLDIAFDGYQEAIDSQKIIDEFAYDSESDIDYPTGSIFCQHGAGYYVSYDEVENHMHLPLYLKEKRETVTKNPYHVSDEELENIFLRTYGPTKHYLSRERKQHSEDQKQVTILPHCLLVDGYNMIFGWESLKDIAKENLDAARARLIDIMCNYQGFVKGMIIVVFDAYKIKKNVGSIEKYDNIYVVYTKEAQTADMYIEKVTNDLYQNYRVTVATSDALEQVIVMAKGATRISARELEMLVDATHHQQMEEFQRKTKTMKNFLLEDLKENQ